MMNSCTTTVGNSQILTAGEKVAANLTPTLKLLRRDHRAAIIYMGCLAERAGVNLTKLCRLASFLQRKRLKLTRMRDCGKIDRYQVHNSLL